MRILLPLLVILLLWGCTEPDKSGYVDSSEKIKVEIKHKEQPDTTIMFNRIQIDGCDYYVTVNTNPSMCHSGTCKQCMIRYGAKVEANATEAAFLEAQEKRKAALEKLTSEELKALGIQTEK